VISPLLSNIYLHEVLDTWFEQTVKPRLRGHAYLYRFADDFIICFESEHDARRVIDVIPKRLQKYGLTIHPEKTKLIRFKRPPYGTDTDNDNKPDTFDLLGFTFYWDKSRKGKWVIKQKTSSKRIRRVLKSINTWLKENRHMKAAKQHEKLSEKLNGHYNYYGITFNGKSLSKVKDRIQTLWQKWLNRRSQRNRMTYGKFNLLLKRYPLPKPVIIHSIYRRTAKLWPEEPDALIGHVRI
jgi:RNA-directed DNA polymerase